MKENDDCTNNSTSLNDQRSMTEYLRLSLYGFLMGSADVVPGVSGGTMAFILGIYDELIDSIRAVGPFLSNIVTFRWRDAFSVLPWKFLVFLGSGIIAAILSLANFIHWALETHPTLIYALFFGLITASVYVVRNRIKSWRAPVLIVIALSALFSSLLVGIRPADTPETLWFVFISGMIAICAMIMPGISGAFILVLLGKYQFILNALTSFNLGVIITFIFGAAIGILAFSNVLRWLLNNYHDMTVAALIGFMLGSLREVWPWKITTFVGEIPTQVTLVLPTALNSETLIAIGLILVGFVMVISLEFFAERHQRIKK